MTDLVPTQPDSLPDQMKVAELLAGSDLVPRAFRGKPANVLLAAQLGQALGLNPAVSLTAVQVIDGTPSLSANAQAALVRRAGHKLRVTSGHESATAALVRSDDPEFVHESTWTKERAVAAGLWGKGAWSKYPESMLVARATTEVIRNSAPDVLLGVAYAPEELGAWPDDVPAPQPVQEVVPEVVEVVADGDYPTPTLDDLVARIDKAETVADARAVFQDAQVAGLLDTDVDDQGVTLRTLINDIGQALAAQG